jgi:hypothetical protein
MDEAEERQSSGHVRMRNTDYHSDDYRDSKTHEVFVSFEPGWGRIYEGQYASTAMYVIDELQKHGLLAAQPSSSQMVQLSEIIYQNRRTHAVDNRLSDIEAMQAISDYLIKEGVLSEPCSQADFLIQDVWRFFPTQSRRFGIRLHAGFGYSYRYSSSQRSQMDKNKQVFIEYHEDTPLDADTTRSSSLATSYEHFTTEEGSPYFVMGVDYHRPVNHRWQVDARAAYTAYFDSDRETIGYLTRTSGDATSIRRSRTTAEVKRHRNVDMSAVLTFIPTSRTEMSLGGVLDWDRADQHQWRYQYESMEEYGEVQSVLTAKDWDVTLDLQASYRVSIPTKLTFGVEIDRFGDSQSSPDSDEEDDRLAYHVWAGVTHYIR